MFGEEEEDGSIDVLGVVLVCCVWGRMVAGG